MSHTQLEIELKFYVPNLTAVKEKLHTLNATLKRERTFEKNVLFDTPTKQLRQSFQLIRLRQDQTTKLTYKGIPDSVPFNTEVKIREELELEISNYQTMATILSRLGYAPVQTYEKYRETFQLNKVEIVLDELPYGSFIELEGDEQSIREAVAILNLPWSARILDNYLLLMDRLQQYHQLPFSDLTFANFTNCSISVADILPTAQKFTFIY